MTKNITENKPGASSKAAQAVRDLKESIFVVEATKLHTTANYRSINKARLAMLDASAAIRSRMGDAAYDHSKPLEVRPKAGCDGEFEVVRGNHRLTFFSTSKKYRMRHFPCVLAGAVSSTAIGIFLDNQSIADDIADVLRGTAAALAAGVTFDSLAAAAGMKSGGRYFKPMWEGYKVLLEAGNADLLAVWNGDKKAPIEGKRVTTGNLASLARVGQASGKSPDALRRELGLMKAELAAEVAEVAEATGELTGKQGPKARQAALKYRLSVDEYRLVGDTIATLHTDVEGNPGPLSEGAYKLLAWLISEYRTV